MNIKVFGTIEQNDNYLITVMEEVRRVLSTKKNTIPMNPEYGCDLYKYRDRTLDNYTKTKIIAEVYDALDKFVKRVIVKRVLLKQEADGKYLLNIEVKKR